MPSAAQRRVLGLVALLGCFFAPHTAQAQWQMQDSHSTASLRGIHAVSGSIAWASGTDGTVLRTQDGGAHWQSCAPPAGAEKLDFRGVWAWDDKNAMIMSSGPGEASRVYKTTDGCAHWSEVARSTDEDSFWDALVFQPQDFGILEDEHTGVLIGDPLKGRFETQFLIPEHALAADDKACEARDGEAGFAASNSMLFVFGSRRYIIATGGKGGPRVLLSPSLAYNDGNKACLGIELPIAGGTESSGAFSVFFRDSKHGIVAGGDYKKPDDATRTAAWSSDGGRHWAAAIKPPHGYRSAVAWYPEAKVWIAVGTNGSDISRDDGKSWERLDDGKWNAVSPPFAVGPGGRVGRLGTDFLKAKPHEKHSGSKLSSVINQCDEEQLRSVCSSLN